MIRIEEGQLPVVGAADENYALYLLVAFTSALINTKDKSKLAFFCIDGGILPKTRTLILKKMEELGSSITFIQVDGTQYDGYKVIKHLSKVAYYRLSIPELFSGKANKVLYLDCDLIVLGDLLDLLPVEFNRQPVAAIEDISRHSHLHTNLQREDYINSGVLLINIDEWNNQKINSKVFSALENKSIDNDQCAINIAVNGTWLRLPLVWNHQLGLYRNKKYLIKNYGKSELNQALFYPKIVHFIGSDKPWNKICYHPWQDVYLKYAGIAGVSLEKATFLEKLIASTTSFRSFKKYLRLIMRSKQLKRFRN